MMSCVACAVARRSIDSHIVFESERIVCFLDHRPINDGHILVCPRQHYSNITDVPDEVVEELIIQAKRFADLLQKTFQCDGVSLLQNNGLFNELGHFHLHVFPRYAADGFAWVSANDEVAKRGRLLAVASMLAARQSQDSASGES